MSDWRTYDDAAPSYHELWEPLTAGGAHDLVELAQPTGSERLLDVGTGTGVLLEEAQTVMGPDGIAVGVDSSVPMVQAARAARPGVRVAAANVVDLPFRDGR